MKVIILPLLLLLSGMSSAHAQIYRSAFQPDEMNDRPIGTPNKVLVLGTPHLHELPDTFRPEMVDPLVARLVEWKPTAIVGENHSGLLCDTMRRQAWRYQQAYKDWCRFDPDPFALAIDLDVIAANAEAERMLSKWPKNPTAEQRRRLAGIFLAAGEPNSALVQWLRLPSNQRQVDNFLTESMVTYLSSKEDARSEGNLISASVAAQAGLERVFSIDDQAFYAGQEPNEDAYAKAIMSMWDNAATKTRQDEDKALIAKLGQSGSLLEIYRVYNSPSYVSLVYASDFGAALKDPSEQAFGRRYLAYWEARNLRMVANMREVLGRKPGTRMLAIVGASHKQYYEAYLAQMRDVELVDVMPMLH